MSPRRLDEVEVTVWYAPPLPTSSGGALLSPVEACRAKSYRRRSDRERFSTARALARAGLGEVLGAPARSIDVRIGPSDGPAPGRPFVPGGPSFSISHAGSWVLVAIVTTAAQDAVSVGVDVESVVTVERHLDPVVGAVPPGERPAGGWTPTSLARSWVRREAVLKAAGTGLLAPPGDLVLASADGPPAVTRSGGALPVPSRLALHDVELPLLECADDVPQPPSYLAALCLCTTPPMQAAAPRVTMAHGSPLLARHGVPVSMPTTSADV